MSKEIKDFLRTEVKIKIFIALVQTLAGNINFITILRLSFTNDGTRKGSIKYIYCEMQNAILVLRFQFLPNL